MSSLEEMMAEAEEAVEKGGDLSEIKSDHHGKSKEHAKKETVGDKVKHAKMAESEKTEEAESSEENEDSKTVKKSVKTKKKTHSKKYQEALTQVDKTKKYPLEEAIELVKKTSLTKFDGNVEVNIRILGKSGKPEILRGLVQYPHSIGKSVKVVILDEAMIEEISKTGKIDFDIALSTPEMMSKVARLAKILGPKGKMPNPKAGTVTTDVVKTKAELEGGKTEYRSDSYGIIHQVIGKVSADPKNLTENYNALLALLPKEKINSISLSATMGPGVKVQK